MPKFRKGTVIDKFRTDVLKDGKPVEFLLSKRQWRVVNVGRYLNLVFNQFISFKITQLLRMIICSTQHLRMIHARTQRLRTMNGDWLSG